MADHNHDHPVMGPPFTLIYAPDVLEHLMHIDRKYHALIRTTIEEQLLFEPDAETLRQMLEEAMGKIAQARGVSHDDMWRAVAEGAAPAEPEPAPARRAPRRRKAAR